MRHLLVILFICILTNHSFCQDLFEKKFLLVTKSNICCENDTLVVYFKLKNDTIIFNELKMYSFVFENVTDKISGYINVDVNKKRINYTPTDELNKSKLFVFNYKFKEKYPIEKFGFIDGLTSINFDYVNDLIEVELEYIKPLISHVIYIEKLIFNEQFELLKIILNTKGLNNSDEFFPIQN